MQGGIERYISTILALGRDRAALASPPIACKGITHFAAAGLGPKAAPQWLRFLLGLFRQRRAFRAWLQANDIGILEYSRPEYGLIAWLFHGKRVFTVHGTGPGSGHRLHFLLHHACCFLLPFIANRVQVVGRDPSGLLKPVRTWLGDRLVYVDAWHDERFSPSPFPPPTADGALKVFYAGRLAPQKDPELLFAIIRDATRIAPGAFEFHYFGSDFDGFARAGLGCLVHNHGFLEPEALAEAMGSCHFGLLCSAFGEGSPYILVESLACGRPFVLSSLPTLVAAYGGKIGVRFVARRQSDDYVAAMIELRNAFFAGEISPAAIAAEVQSQSQSRAVPKLLDVLCRLEEPRPC
jgi:glycosyltransferase involved in cell wall biosynthesis